MPIFEFVCADCGKPFEELVFSTNKIDEVSCPTCQSRNLTKQISSFASRLSGAGFSLGNTSSSSCGTGSA